MSKVSDALITMADAVIEKFNLSEDAFDEVQEIILDNQLPLNDKEKVFEFFKDKVVCPQCLSLDGPKCKCWNKE